MAMMSQVLNVLFTEMIWFIIVCTSSKGMMYLGGWPASNSRCCWTALILVEKVRVGLPPTAEKKGNSP